MSSRADSGSKKSALRPTSCTGQLTLSSSARIDGESGITSAFEVRVYGPFLVVRSAGPTRTLRRYLRETRAVQVVGQSLYIGDADVNIDTVDRALSRLG